MIRRAFAVITLVMVLGLAVAIAGTWVLIGDVADAVADAEPVTARFAVEFVGAVAGVVITFRLGVALLALAVAWQHERRFRALAAQAAILDERRRARDDAASERARRQR